MGVHDLDRYDEVRSALGIPEGEPLFIIRAKDVLSVEALDFYRRNYTQQAMLTNGEITISEIDRFKADIEKTIVHFIDWQQKHPESMKFPD